MCKNDKGMILSRNLRCVFKNWCISENKWKSEKCLILVKIILKNVNM